MSRAFGFFSLFALLPWTFALAADQRGDPESFVKRIPNNEIPLEELAHSLFFHGRLDSLKEIVSEEGFKRIEPELAEHRSEMKDSSKIVAKVRQACSGMRSAKSGEEFAAVLRRIEEKDQNENRQAARRILSMLDGEDRQAAETYLDTDVRLRTVHSRIDLEAKFASAPFPSAETDRVTRRTCDAVAEAEGRARP